MILIEIVIFIYYLCSLLLKIFSGAFIFYKTIYSALFLRLIQANNTTVTKMIFAITFIVKTPHLIYFSFIKVK